MTSLFTRGSGTRVTDAEDAEAVAGLAGNGALDVSLLLTDQTREILRRRQTHRTSHRRGWVVRRALMVADLIGLTAAFGAAEVLYRGTPSIYDKLGAGGEVLAFFALLPLWVVAARLYGLYDRDEARANHNTADDVVGVFNLVTIGVWVMVAFAYLTGLAEPAIVKVLFFWLFAIPLVTMMRYVARAGCRRRLFYRQLTLIVGAGDVGQLVASKILRHPEYGISLVGFVDDQPKRQLPGLEELTLLGSPDQLEAIVRKLDIERIIIAFSNDPIERTLELVRALGDLDVQIDVVPRLFDLVSPSVEIHTLEGMPLLAIPSLRLSRSSMLLKRSMDFVVATVGLLLLAPFFLVAACAIKLDSRGPVFFRQRRMGSTGEPFRIFKFRTMVVDAEQRRAGLEHLNKHLAPGSDPRMFKIPDDPRVTRVGRFLRRYSLDEFPQLLNVLKGDMSLVGPRPLILDEDKHVDSWARKRMALKPGMTGLWQVLGRSEIPFDEMIKLDYLYVTTWSIWQDLRLLLRTIPIVAGSSGTSY